MSKWPHGGPPLRKLLICNGYTNNGALYIWGFVGFLGSVTYWFPRGLHPRSPAPARESGPKVARPHTPGETHE